MKRQRKKAVLSLQFEVDGDINDARTIADRIQKAADCYTLDPTTRVHFYVEDVDQYGEATFG